MKKCPKCNTEKPLTEYDKYWSKSRQTYRPQSYCKECKAVDARKRANQHYQDNRDRKLKYAKKYRSENKDKLRKQKRRFKRKYVKELHSCYVSEQLSSVIDVPQRVISQEPEMIEAYRTVLKIKRRIRDAKK